MRIEYFTVTDGLSAREINDLHVGDDGYLWVATMDGLNRFDGHSFLSFGQDPSNPAGLRRGPVDRISSDNQGNLIVVFKRFSGYFDLFNPRDFRVERVKMVPSTGVTGYPQAIETDSLGRTFVVTIWQGATHLYEYTHEGFKLIYSNPDDNWKVFSPNIHLLPLHNGQFLLYDEEHGFRHLSAGGQYLGNVNLQMPRGRRMHQMIEGPDGYVYMSFQDGYPLYRWRPGAKSSATPVPRLDPGLQYPRIYRDTKGQLLLLGTEDILGNQYPDEYYLIDTAGNFQLFDRELPTDRPVTAVAAVDFTETVYLGLREGLGVIERNVKPIDTYLTKVGRRSDRVSVSGIAEDTANTIYIALSNGAFYTMARDSKELNDLPLRALDNTPLRVRRPGQLMYDRIRNAVWAVGYPSGLARGGLLLRYNVATGTSETYPAPHALTAIAMSPEGDIYLGATISERVGLLRFDAASGTFTEPIDEATNRTLPRISDVNCLYYSRSGKLLIGTDHRGLITYDPVTGQLAQFDRTAGTEEGMRLKSEVYTIYEDLAGKWWLGTQSGLQCVNPIDSSVVTYTRQNGLSSNSVVGIVPDSTGGYWVSTRDGLVHLPKDVDNGTFRRYYTEDGLASDDFQPFAAHRDHTGRYFFGGVTGLSVFRDQDLSLEKAGSDVMLTEVAIYGRGESRVRTRNLDELEAIEVKASEKSIALSFALPVGQRPSLTQLRVKLDGFNDEWRELRNERTVRYNNLPSGNYVLMVQAADANGNYGDRMRTLRIHVRQYVIEKTWFQFLIATVIVGLFFFILQAKLRERLRNEQLRTQLSSDIHDEVSGLLAGITLQAELLQHRTEDEKLRQRLQTVGEAGRNAMSKMSDVIWSIDSRRDNIGNLLQRMQEHADEVLLPLDIRYDFTAKGFNNERELAGNVRQDLYFIYKEAINNVARHSNATYVEVELEQYAQTFEMFIRDNGTVKKSDEYPVYSSSRFTPKKGQGKDNMRMRAQRLRAELTIDDRSGYTLTLRMRRLS